jgi:CubicO group peptidase (beta-lactamase class C family)
MMGGPKWWRGGGLSAVALVALTSFTLLAGSPQPSAPVDRARADPDRPPAALGDGWEVASPGSVGLDADALDALARRLSSGEFGQVDGFIVARDGKLVFERYFGGYTAYTLHTLQSVTKSIASILVGLALQEGFIDHLDQPIADLLPEYGNIFAAAPAKRAITLRHVLTMTAGLDWPEQGVPYDGANIVWALSDAVDWPGFVLERPLIAEPGQVFNYSTGLSTLLSAIIQNRSGIRADLFAERYLFDPLGIPNYGWWRNTRHPARWAHTGGGLHLSPRDLAKIGALYTNRGRWQDRKILDPEWIAESMEARLATGRFDDESYGYQWWLRPLRDGGASIPPNAVVQAAGIGGQHLLIVPGLRLVVVFTGTNFDDIEMARRPLSLLYDHILPAIQSHP